MINLLKIRKMGKIIKDKHPYNILYVNLSGVNRIFKKSSKIFKKIPIKRLTKNITALLIVKKYKIEPKEAPKMWYHLTLPSFVKKTKKNIIKVAKDQKRTSCIPDKNIPVFASKRIVLKRSKRNDITIPVKTEMSRI